jgi:hypothetical protein
VASPDTDELATIPLPAAAPAAPEAEPPVVEQERVEPERVEPDQNVPADASPDASPDALPGASPDASSDAEADSPTGSAKARGRWWRGFTGSLAAGLTVLAIGVLVVAVICQFTGAPGPGTALLVGHPVAAALALLAQRVADRRNGPPAAGAGMAVVLFTVSALTLFWLA